MRMTMMMMIIFYWKRIKSFSAIIRGWYLFSLGWHCFRFVTADELFCDIITILCLFRTKYLWKRHEPLYSTSYVLDSSTTTSTKMALKLNNPLCLVWFGLVLWHINHCRLFNAESIFILINISISNNSV